jgi:LacI family transcriptional regulator
MPGRRRAKLVDVARRAGVSPATVSRALTQPQIVRPEKLALIESAIRELGYFRDGAARALGSQRASTIGVIVPTLDHAIFARAIQAMQTRLAEAGYQLLVASHEYNPVVEEAALRALIERGLDAVALVGADHTDGVFQLLERADKPVVLTWSLREGFDCVGFDNRRAGRLAAEHLLDLGHSRFGVVSGFLRYNDRARERLEGVREALEARGLSLPAAQVSEQPFTLAGGRAGFAALAALATPPTAIVAGNDLLAVGAIAEAHERGFAVPRDLSVVGIDDLELAAHTTPPLTTVRLPTYELGQRAANMLLARLQGLKTRQTIELAVDLVVRRSTAPPRVGANEAAGTRRPAGTRGRTAKPKTF